MSEKDSLLSGTSTQQGVEHVPIYEERHRTKEAKVALGLLFGIISSIVGITIITTSVQAYKVTPLYIMLMINLLAIANVPIVMTCLIYTQRLSKSCLWAVFIVGVFVGIEAININILVFTI